MRPSGPKSPEWLLAELMTSKRRRRALGKSGRARGRRSSCRVFLAPHFELSPLVGEHRLEIADISSALRQHVLTLAKSTAPFSGGMSAFASGQARPSARCPRR